MIVVFRLLNYTAANSMYCWCQLHCQSGFRKTHLKKPNPAVLGVLLGFGGFIGFWVYCGFFGW